jgi:hypothetical protein
MNDVSNKPAIFPRPRPEGQGLPHRTPNLPFARATGDVEANHLEQSILPHREDEGLGDIVEGASIQNWADRLRCGAVLAGAEAGAGD